MELSRGQQRLLFAVVVLLLAGLGIYLVGPGTHHGAGASPSASASGSPAAATSTPATLVPSAVLPATPAATSSGTGGTDIYQWLPFTQQDLTEAAQATVAFATDYETFSYTEAGSAYAGKMANVVTAELAATLENAYVTPGVAAQRSAQKQISESSGGIAAIHAFGTGSITFFVNIVQKLATTAGTSSKTTEYAVTVVSAAGGWEVNDVEFANAGNT